MQKCRYTKHFHSSMYVKYTLYVEVDRNGDFMQSTLTLASSHSVTTISNIISKPQTQTTIKLSDSHTRLTRWELLKEAQKLLPDERVAFCMHRTKASNVDILYNPQHQSAHYGGLMACGSVWVCPICAVKISERRRVELERAIKVCVDNGGAVYLATYTISHKRFDNLSTLLQSFLAARKRMKQGRKAQEIRKQFSVLGTVSVREVTWSEQNGWHPHCHELIFFEKDIDAEVYAQVTREQWQRSAEHEGLSMNEHGFKLDRTYGTVADYVAKFGREPARTPWSAATEMTKGHLKRGHGDEHLTPFAMLYYISQGHNELKPVFREYAHWFKGKHQLVWSSGLRALLLHNEEEKSDLELVEEAEEEAILLGQLDREQWHQVVLNNAQGKLLEVARSGDWQMVIEFLIGIGICYSSNTLGETTRLVSANS